MKRKMSNKAFVLDDIVVNPGESKYVELPLPGLYTHSHIHMPVHVSCGKEAGPVMFISAAVHGDEINGVEIIRRMINLPALKKLKGTLVAVPVVNVYGFISKSRYLPDRRDLNRSFPGSEKGSMASKLAHMFLTSISNHCDYGIDLHTAAISRDNLPQIRALLENDDIKELAMAFGAPVVLNAPLREGSLREAASHTNTKVLLYEAGEALRFDEISIRAGVQGITNVMRKVGMLPASRKRNKIESAVAHSSTWVRAPQSGILRSTNPMGQRIHKGDILGFVSDPFGETGIEVISPVSGMVIGRTTLPLVHKGEAIFHIARFNELSEAESVLETFQNHIDPVEDDVNFDSYDHEPVIY